MNVGVAPTRYRLEVVLRYLDGGVEEFRLGLIFFKAVGLTLESGEVRFEPTNEVLPIIFYLLHALWDFVNKEVSSGKLKPTFATSRIFLMNSDKAFIGLAGRKPLR